MSCTLKHLEIPFLEISYCDLVTVCHGFCISYGLAHVLSDYSLFQVSHAKTIILQVPTFWCYCSHFFITVNIFVSVFLQIPKFSKFQIFWFLGCFHTNRLINCCSDMSTIVSSDQSNVFSPLFRRVITMLFCTLLIMLYI